MAANRTRPSADECLDKHSNSSGSRQQPSIDEGSVGTPFLLTKGILTICAAFFLSAATGAMGKFLPGVPSQIFVFFQYAVSSIILLPFASRGGFRTLRTCHTILHVVRSVSGALSQMLYFVALMRLPLLTVSLLSNAAPIFIPIIVWVWLRKKVQPAVVIGLLAGMVGMIVVIRPGPEMFRDPNALVALSSALFSAVGLVTTNKLTHTEPPMRILALNFRIGTLLLIPIAVLSWRPLSLHALLLLSVISIAFAMIQWLIIVAYRFGSASALSPFNYSVVIFAGMFSWVIFGDVPSASAIAGTILIIGGGVLSIEGGHSEGLGNAIGNGHWAPELPEESQSPL